MIKRKKRKPQKSRAKCRLCYCPLTNLMLGSKRETRVICAACTEKRQQPPTRYGSRPLEKRLGKREYKRQWAASKRDVINERRKERIAADPDKYREARRLYRLRYEQRRKAGLPPIRECSDTLHP